MSSLIFFSCNTSWIWLVCLGGDNWGWKIKCSQKKRERERRFKWLSISNPTHSSSRWRKVCPRLSIAICATWLDFRVFCPPEKKTLAILPKCRTFSTIKSFIIEKSSKMESKKKLQTWISIKSWRFEGKLMSALPFPLRDLKKS